MPRWGSLQIFRRELGEGIGRGLFKTREAAAENEFDLVGRAVALLGNQDVGLIALLGRRIDFEKVWPVDEHHHVGGLFDSAGFAKVGELRAPLLAFRSAGN